MTATARGCCGSSSATRPTGSRTSDWEPFFETFDRSDVDFLYQEHTKDGGDSRFHKIVRTDAQTAT